jgi:hypothetical protein
VHTRDGPVPRIGLGGGWVGVAGDDRRGGAFTRQPPAPHALRLGIGLTLSNSLR